MNKTVAALRTELENGFVSTIEKIKENNTLSLSDLYVMVKIDSSELETYDDLETLLLTTPLASLEQWQVATETNMQEELQALLTEVVGTEKIKSSLEELNISTPFSVIWVDEQMGQLAELLTIDYDNMLLNNDFFDKIDRELDAFFDRIMKDII